MSTGGLAQPDVSPCILVNVNFNNWGVLSNGLGTPLDRRPLRPGGDDRRGPLRRRQAGPPRLHRREGRRQGHRQDEVGRGHEGPDAAGGPAHEAGPAPARGK